MSEGRLQSSERLAIVRDRIKRRREAATKADEVRARFLAQLDDGDKIHKVVVRCSERHRNGKKPKLAQAYLVAEGWLFVSRIAWLPSDQLTLRPWLRDVLEGPGLDGESLRLALEDDDYLTSLLDDHDSWSLGHERLGERWLHRSPEHRIVSMVEPNPADQLLGLWVRCKDHPAAVEQISAADLFVVARKLSAPKHRLNAVR